nr:MAG TPA: hypothetical protein [Caudoviricetes sp.]
MADIFDLPRRLSAFLSSKETPRDLPATYWYSLCAPGVHWRSGRGC